MTVCLLHLISGKGKGKSTAAPADPSKRPRKRAKHAPAEPVPSAAQDGYSLLLEISLLRKAFEKCGVEEQDAALDCTIIKWVLRLLFRG